MASKDKPWFQQGADPKPAGTAKRPGQTDATGQAPSPEVPPEEPDDTGDDTDTGEQTEAQGAGDPLPASAPGPVPTVVPAPPQAVALIAIDAQGTPVAFYKVTGGAARQAAALPIWTGLALEIFQAILQTLQRNGTLPQT